ncbi:facilitated trehalose transporter Tret1-like [Onthophagus taurus]|uniref:facilitated trehalose transporter Tret1-like n=1 Tax=Onthophagus taurus TaxID=166361 RepID=UPI0039BDE11C
MSSKNNIPFNKFLYFSVFTTNQAGLMLGLIYGWSSPAIPRLNGSIEPENNPLPSPITLSQESWIASLLPLGCIFSAFITGLICDKIGRKRTLLTAAIPCIVGFTLCGFPKNVYYFYFGRFFSGLGCGIIAVVMPIFVGEISEKHNRGLLCCVYTVAISIGNLLFFGLTPYCGIYALSIFGLIVSILFLITFTIFIPESPYYLLMKGELNKARKSLLKLRCNNTKIVEIELPIIKKNIDETLSIKRNFFDFFKDKALSRGLMIALGLAAFQQLSGINIIFFYMQSIFEESQTGLSSDLCTVFVGLVQLVCSVVTSITIDKFGRKILLLVSAIGMLITLTVLSIYYHLKERNFDVQNISSLPIWFINLYVMTYTLGFGPIVFGVAGEIFPLYAKSIASTLTTSTGLISTFFITSLFPYLKESIGIGYTFTILAVICGFAGCFVYVKVPETKGKTLEEIEVMLKI